MPPNTIAAPQTQSYNTAAQVASVGRNANYDRQNDVLKYIGTIMEQRRAQMAQLAAQTAISQADRSQRNITAQSKLASDEGIAQGVQQGAFSRQGSQQDFTAEQNAIAAAAAARQAEEDRALQASEGEADRNMKTGIAGADIDLRENEGEAGREHDLTRIGIENQNRKDLFEAQLEADKQREIRSNEFTRGMAKFNHLLGQDMKIDEYKFRIDMATLERNEARKDLRFAADLETKSAERVETMTAVRAYIAGDLTDDQMKGYFATAAEEDRYLLSRAAEIKWSDKFEAMGGGEGPLNVKGISSGELKKLEKIAELIPDNKFIQDTMERLSRHAVVGPATAGNRVLDNLNLPSAGSYFGRGASDMVDWVNRPENLQRIIRQQLPDTTPEDLEATSKVVADLIKQALGVAADPDTVDFGTALGVQAPEVGAPSAPSGIDRLSKGSDGSIRISK